MGNVLREPIENADSMQARGPAIFTIEGPNGPEVLSVAQFFGAIFRPSPVNAELPHPEIEIKPYVPSTPAETFDA